MRITAVKTLPFAYAFQGAHASKYLRGQSVKCLFVGVETSDGVTGFGEICDSFCCSYPYSTAAVIEEALAPLLLDGDPTLIEDLTQKMRRATRRRLSDRGMAMQAISGVEIALWDLLGKIESKPISRLLGQARRRVPVYASGSFLDEGPTEWHREFYEPCLQRGITTVKTRIGKDYRRDLKTLRALRQLLRDEIQILVDGGELFTFVEALEIARTLAELGVRFFEEPLPQSEGEAIACLVEKSPLPIAYGEHLFTVHDFHDCLVHHRAHVIQPDASICGGISEGLKIAALGENAGVPVIPHSAAGPVSLAANLQMAAAANTSLLEDSFPLEPLWRDLLDEPLFSLDAVQEGTLLVPEGAGLGLVFNEHVVSPREARPR
jgi:L-alanine-DL-glutamate epimerase-like enolase superfamily enzyme